jgi:hypothetical protein
VKVSTYRTISYAALGIGSFCSSMAVWDMLLGDEPNLTLAVIALFCLPVTSCAAFSEGLYRGCEIMRQVHKLP